MVCIQCGVLYVIKFYVWYVYNVVLSLDKFILTLDQGTSLQHLREPSCLIPSAALSMVNEQCLRSLVTIHMLVPSKYIVFG